MTAVLSEAPCKTDLVLAPVALHHTLALRHSLRLTDRKDGPELNNVDLARNDTALSYQPDGAYHPVGRTAIAGQTTEAFEEEVGNSSGKPFPNSSCILELRRNEVADSNPHVIRPPLVFYESVHIHTIL